MMNFNNHNPPYYYNSLNETITRKQVMRGRAILKRDVFISPILTARQYRLGLCDHFWRHKGCILLYYYCVVVRN